MPKAISPSASRDERRSAVAPGLDAWRDFARRHGEAVGAARSCRSRQGWDLCERPYKSIPTRPEPRSAAVVGSGTLSVMEKVMST